MSMAGHSGQTSSRAVAAAVAVAPSSVDASARGPRRNSVTQGPVLARRMSVVLKGNYKSRKKGGRDGTPDKPSSPNLEMDDENESQRKVIINDEILALRVKPEDLEKIREPKPPAEGKKSPTTTSVIIRKLKPPVEFNQTRAHSVVVAKPAPPDAPVLPPSYDGIMCARFDNNGNIIPHSILGDIDEFKEEALRRGDIPAVDFETSRSSVDHNERLTVKFEKKTKKRGYPKFASADESNALKNWEDKMHERRRQQGYLSRLLNKPVSQLVMNQGDGFRKTQELRYLIDRTIPFIDNGKGYRVGSEFWKQQVQIGGELDGMHVTLNLSEKGYPPPIEHVGVPRCALNDKGVESELPSTVIHKPWHKSAYLRERVIQLAPLMDELDPHEPDLTNLEIVGNSELKDENCMNAINAQMCSDHQKLQKKMECEGRYESALDTHDEDPFQEIPDVHPAPVFGPSIQFAGQPARWTGDSHNFRGQVGIEARVSFESDAGQRTTSFLEIVNDGTTCIYYNWKKVTKPNTFDLINANMQRFYFNPGNGVILPGDTMKFPFVFKSSNAGIFSEQWEFHTHPVVCGGAVLLVTLRGVALKHDKFERQREDVERELRRKEADQIVSDVLDGLFKGLQTPERPRSPVDAYVTEDELFQRRNPKLQFSKEKCDQLRDLYVEAFPEEDRCVAPIWDLSLHSVRQAILQISEDDNRKQDLLLRLNQVVTSMSFKPILPTLTPANRVGYTILCLGVDKLTQSAIRLSQVTGYQESRPVSSVPSSADSKRSRGKEKKGGKDKSTSSKGKDKERASSAKSPQGSKQRVTTPSSPAPPQLLPDVADAPSPSVGKTLETKAKYQEKLYTLAHETICGVIDEMDLALAKVLNRRDVDLRKCEPPLSTDL